MKAEEVQLADVLSEFARTMLTEFPIQAILDRLVVRIVDILPIEAAGVALISPGVKPAFVAASDESALRFEDLQAALGEGPCVEAHRTGSAVSIPDLRTDRRFATFGPRALEAGLVAVFAFPLCHGNEPLGALDLYRDAPGPLSPATMSAAQTLADVAAAYILNARTRADLLNAARRSLELSLHDPLTKLPNRMALIEHLDRALRRARRPGNTVTVLFADLDQFKQVNDLHGHRTGDELLVAVAERLARIVRPGDTLARLSGDEFVIVCEDLKQVSQADAIVGRIAKALAAPFVLPNARVSVTISASVGVAFAGNHDRKAEELLHDADVSMYHAKQKAHEALAGPKFLASEDRNNMDGRVASPRA